MVEVGTVLVCAHHSMWASPRGRTVWCVRHGQVHWVGANVLEAKMAVGEVISHGSQPGLGILAEVRGERQCQTRTSGARARSDMGGMEDAPA